MKCTSSNKFTTMTLEEPESPDVSVEFNGDKDDPEFTISGSMRIVRTCDECGEEMKEATLDIEQTVELGEGLMDGEKAEAEKVAFADLDNATVEDESTESIEEGGGRYQKSYFGARVSFVVRAGPDDTVVARVEWSDKVAASSMDELV